MPPYPSKRSYVRGSGPFLIAFALLVGIAGVVAAASPSRTAVPASVGLSSTAYDWPEFHHDPGLTGVSADPALSASTDSTLGIKWVANTYGPLLASPVTTFDVALNRTVAYIGNDLGFFSAYDATNGALLWSRALTGPIDNTATISNGAVWIAAGGVLYKLDESTGSTLCTAAIPGKAQSDAVIATPPGGTPTVFQTVLDTATADGPLTAVNVADCKTKFSWNSYVAHGGSWSPASAGVDKNGRGLVLFGSSDPDSTVYAIDESTGLEAWHFTTINATANNDVGSGPVVSPPGVNGFADGVVYVAGKDGYVFALDLTTGLEIWQYHFGADSTHPHGGQGTVALDGTTLVIDFGAGVEAIDVHGSLTTPPVRLWKDDFGTAAVISSPAIIGSPGNEAVAFGDPSGSFRVVRFSDGSPILQMSLPGFVVSSPADANGSLVVGDSQGLVYDFGPGGEQSVSAATVINAPADGSSVANSGAVAIQGTATAATGVAQVHVAVREDNPKGSWWNATTSTWSPTPTPNPAILGSPGSASTTWTLSVPTPAAGTVLNVFAQTADSGGAVDVRGPTASFTVLPSPGAPAVVVTNPWVAPGGSVTLSGSGFGPAEFVSIADAGKVIKRITTTSTGALPATAILFGVSAVIGPTALTATGLTSHKISSVVVHVSNSWPQYGYSVTRPGYAPNDKAIFLTPTISPTTLLAPVWSRTSASPIHSAASIVDGVAYYGNDAGLVSAVSIRSGALLWSFAAGGAIDSEPAVDSGLAIVGAGDGKVYALNSKTGALVWSYTTGAAVESSPAVAGGVVYVGSDDKSVYALNEATGVVIWVHALGGAVISSPAVDAAANIVVVGDQSGSLTALTLAGAPKWSHLTGGPVDASPLISGGNVYIGSNDGTFYAFSEPAGSSVWSNVTGAPIHDSASVSGTVIHVGSNNGNVYTFVAASGAVMSTKALGAAVTSVMDVFGVTFATTSTGDVFAIQAAGYYVWQHTYSSASVTRVTVVNGGAFIGAGDGTFTCFTLFGRAPNP